MNASNLLLGIATLATTITPIGAAEALLRITEFGYNEGTQTFDLTFASSEGDEYVVEGSDDLQRWSEPLASPVIGSSGMTTTVSGISAPPLADGGYYVRVRRLAPFVQTVTVGNPGNEPDSSPFEGETGAVGYSFEIGKFEVTNAQYAEFLNAVAADDPNGLYDPRMDSSAEGGIARSGSPPRFTYVVKDGLANKPVIYVSWYSALRFCNWLHNGRPEGPQAGTTTEGGAYTMTGATGVADGSDPIHGANGRNSGARFHLPSKDEWHKAAYHEPGVSTDGYWRYPTRSDIDPVLEAPPGGSNSANYDTVVGTLTEVGAYQDSASFYRTFDQGGNVQEWTEHRSSAFPESRELRGGSWFIDSGGMRACFRDIGSPDTGGGGIGFRVAAPCPLSLGP